MTAVVVWSERDDVVAGEHDCAYSSALMLLVHGGKTSYPLGEYTAAEREALERSDDRTDETGASSLDIDTAVSRRYALSLRTPAAGDTLATAWQTGRALSVGGNLSNLPPGDFLRRWAPTYTGGHRWCVIPTDDTHGVVLDPLATWKYPGDPVTLNQVAIFSKLRAVTDIRFTLADEFATQGGVIGGLDLGYPVTIPPAPVGGSVSVPPGRIVTRLSDGAAITLSQGASARTGYKVQHAVATNDGAYGFLIDVTADGVTEACFVKEGDCMFTPAASPTATKLGPGLYEVAA